METRQRMSARNHRQQEQQRQRRSLLALGILGLMIIVVVGTVALIGRGATDEGTTSNPASVVVSDHQPPPNAEQNGRAWGPKDAPIQVIEYVDYECESCGAFAVNYEADFIAAFAESGQIRFEIRNAPFHGDGARNAAEGAYCAVEQNAFWPMHNSLFLNQPTSHAPDAGVEAFSDARLNAIAAQLQLDTAAFEQCMSADRYVQQVDDDYNVTVQNGIDRTPTFVINGQAYPGVLDVDTFRQIFADIAPEVEFDS